MKNIKNYIGLVIVLFASLTLFFSCYGEPNEPTNENTKLSFREYLRDMSIIKGNGTILIQSNQFEVNQNLENNIDISVKQNQSDLLKIYDVNKNKIDITQCNENIAFKRSFFGNHLNYKINNIEISELYIPKLLKIEDLNSVIKTGSVLKWNTDTKNKKGIILWLSYSPLDQADMRIISDNRKIITHGLTTDDDGSYALTEEDLERFPNNSVLRLNIARTNYIINDEQNPSLIAFTTVCKNVGFIR